MGVAMTKEQAEIMALREGNPIIKACAVAAQGAAAAFSTFNRDLVPEKPWDALDKSQQSDVLEDVWVLMNGGGPQEVYARYDHGGILWPAAQPAVQLRYILFARVMGETFSAVTSLAEGHRAALERTEQEKANG